MKITLLTTVVANFIVASLAQEDGTPEAYLSWAAQANNTAFPTSLAISQSPTATTTVILPVTTNVVYTTLKTTITVSPTACGMSVSTTTSACALPTAPLANQEQVGNSTWGTLCQPTFPKWLGGSNGEPYVTAPWGNKTTKNTDATILGSMPETNVTRYYNFTVSRGQISADGVLRDVILINDQFPGPVIEANWGDWVQVTVNNNISNPFEGTSLHWHGTLQRSTPWYDGVPSVSQCPIAPHHSFTYNYQADVFGTSWYHAHYSAQYAGGAAGPMIVHGPSSLDYDIDVGPVMLSDWYHVPYFSIVADAVGTNLSLIPPTSDSVLINGRNSFNCSQPSYSNSTEWLGSNLQSNISWTCVEDAELSKFSFTPGKVHRLRLINHGANGIHKFSIDGHNMTVIATDYVPLSPYRTQVVTLSPGQRTDVLVTADNESASSFWMRTEAAGGALCGGSNNPEALAAIYYEGADTTVLPQTTSDVPQSSSFACQNDDLSLTQPDYAIAPTPDPFQQELLMTIVVNASHSGEWRMNNQTFHANFNEPLLSKAAVGNVSYPQDPQWNVYNFNQNKSVVLNVTNGTPFAHPMHLHGHTFYVLNEGHGTWDGSTVNPGNPMRRDTQIIQGFGFAAIQFDLDNPGVWPFHCHTAWHQSGGMAINIVSQPQDIPQIPDVMPQTCKDWDYYTNNNVVDQIDAGA